MKKCTKCGISKPIEEYYKHGKYYVSRCKKCTVAYMKLVKECKEDNSGA